MENFIIKTIEKNLNSKNKYFFIGLMTGFISGIGFVLFCFAIDLILLP